MWRQLGSAIGQPPCFVQIVPLPALQQQHRQFDDELRPGGIELKALPIAFNSGVASVEEDQCDRVFRLPRNAVIESGAMRAEAVEGFACSSELAQLPYDGDLSIDVVRVIVNLLRQALKLVVTFG